MADFGTDFATVGGDDIDPTFRLVSGREALVLSIVRRFATPALFYAPGYGEDLRRWLGETVTAAKLAQLNARAAAQCLRDERVRRAAARSTYSTATRVLTVRLALEDAAGPFELVLAVSEAAGVVLEGVN